MKFKFESSFVGFGSPKNTMEFEVDQLEDVLLYFKQFLQGSGYVINGVLDIIPDEEYYSYPDVSEPGPIPSESFPNMHDTIDDDGRC